MAAAAAAPATTTPDLLALKALDVAGFLEAWAKYDSADLRDRLKGSPRAALVAFCEGLLAQVTAAVEQLHAALPAADDDDGNTAAADDGEAPPQAGDDDSAADAADKEARADAALQALRLAALLCADALAECVAAPPEALQSAAITLHDRALLELGDARPGVQDAVVRLCCAWWAAEATSREFLVSQALPYLLLRAISTGKAAAVRQCYAMRGALELLDFEDASIADMQRMLLQAAISPAFVGRPDGRKFLAALLTVHPSMVAEVAAVVRNQIPAGRRGVLDAYGDVVLRGWRGASGGCLAAVESELIQGLMRAAIHASTPGLAANIRRVLGELHRCKRLGSGPGAVDAMLVRLYEPVLFRGLAAANAAVRRNALQLLLDAFPLLDPDAPPEEQDELLVRQFQALSDALTDPCPAVRAVAAAGTCAVLNLYWEIIPSATTAGYVSRLTGALAFDAAAPAVRVAVLEGLQLLVDNQHAQPVLKRALPQLAPLMFDASPRVREALADLLLCISTSRGLHFWEVVPLDALLDELAAEGGGAGGGASATAQKLHQLLVPSYFPGPEDGAARVAALLKERPAAGRAFCRLLVAPYVAYLDGGKGSHQAQVPLEDVLALAQALAAHLVDHPPAAEPRSPPRKQRHQGGRAAAAANGNANGSAGTKRKKAAAAAAAGEEEGGDGEETHDVPASGAREESPEAWSALLSGLAELCAGVGLALQAGLLEERDLADLFDGGALAALLAACPSAAAQRCVWRVAEALPCLAAAEALLASCLGAFGEGKLLPSGGGGGDGDGDDAADAAAVLASLAAGASGGRLCAMLRAALGLPWASSDAAAAPRAADADDAARAARAAGDDVCCGACGRAEPEDSMLLCDGCSAALHTGCLAPALAAVPEGDWLCPGCVADVRAASLTRADARAYYDLLMRSDSGRAMLARGGLLGGPALAALERDAAAAAAAAAAGSSSGGDAASAAEALRAAMLVARAQLHALSQPPQQQPASTGDDDDDEAAAAASAAAAAGAPAALAAQAAAAVRAIERGAAPLCALSADAAAASGARRQADLADAIRRALGLLADVWAAFKALSSRLPVGGSSGSDDVAAAAVAGSVGTAAGAAAGAGRSLLTGLAALGGSEAGGAVAAALGLNARLLRALLAAPAAAPAADAVGAWLLAALEALARGPLSGAAAGALGAELPALVGALLASEQRQQQQGQGQQGAACAADAWLPLVSAAAAEADIDDGGDDDDTAARRDDGWEEGEEEEGKARAAKEPLPPLLRALAVAARAKQHRQAAAAAGAKALRLCVDRAGAGDFDASLGALRVGRLLNGGAGAGGAAEASLFDGEQRDALRLVVDAAKADNGAAAHLLTAALARMGVA